MQRNWLALAVATSMLLVWSAGAQAVTIDLGKSRKARLSESGDSVVFGGKQKGSLGIFSVTMDSAGSVDVEIRKRKGGKKRVKRYTMDLDAGVHDFRVRGKKRVSYGFSESAPAGPAVPEPGTALLLGADLAGLGLAGRRRR